MTAEHSTEKRGQRGIVLVVVLWVLALLGIVAASFLRETRVETRVTRNLVENAVVHAPPRTEVLVSTRADGTGA